MHSDADKQDFGEYSNQSLQIEIVPYLTTLGSFRRGIDVIGEIAGTIIYLSSIGSIGGIDSIGGIGSIGEIGGIDGIGRGRAGVCMPTLDIGGSGRGKGGKEGEEEEDGNSKSGHGARHCH